MICIGLLGATIVFPLVGGGVVVCVHVVGEDALIGIARKVTDGAVDDRGDTGLGRGVVGDSSSIRLNGGRTLSIWKW